MITLGMVFSEFFKQLHGLIITVKKKKKKVLSIYLKNKIKKDPNIILEKSTKPFCACVSLIVQYFLDVFMRHTEKTSLPK